VPNLDAGERQSESSSDDGGSSTYEDQDESSKVPENRQVSEVYEADEVDEADDDDPEEPQKKESGGQTSVLAEADFSSSEEPRDGHSENSGSEEVSEVSEESDQTMAQAAVERAPLTDTLLEKPNAMRSSTASAKRSGKPRSGGGKRKKNGNSKPRSSAPESPSPSKGEEPSPKKSRKGGKITNKRRTSLHVNQHVSVDRIKRNLNYGSIHLADGVREAISDSMNFFATKILLQAKALVEMKGKERLSKEDISSSVGSIVPYSPLSARMHAKMGRCDRTWLTHLNDRKADGGASTRVEKACGLNVSISSLKNLAKQVIPTIGALSSNGAFIELGAAVETVGEAIIHRAVGALISTSVKKLSKTPGPDDEESNFFDVSFKKSGSLTLSKDHVNLALHYMINTDQIRNYSSHQAYSHRRLDYETEMEKALEQNAKRAPSFRSKKRSLKQKVKRRVEDTNSRGLLSAKEITSYLVRDNTLPLIFRDLKLVDTSTIVDIRSDAIPERMRHEFRTLINGEGVMQSDHTALRTLGILWKEVAESSEAVAWYPHHRE
jgi:hypothetical protein